MPPGYGPPGAGPVGSYGATPPAKGRSKAPLVIAAALVTLVGLAVAAFFLLRTGDDEVDLTESEMEDALLTPDDVGSGFAEDEDTDDDDDDSDDFDLDDVDASEECLNLLEEAKEMEAGSFFAEGVSAAPRSVKRKLGDEDGQAVEHEIADDAPGTLDDVREFIEVCPEFDYGDSDGGGSFSFDEGEPVDVGDDSVSLRLSIVLDEPVNIEVETLWVIWTRDGITSSVAVTGEVDDDLVFTEPDPALLLSAVEKADTKLEDVIDEAG